MYKGLNPINYFWDIEILEIFKCHEFFFLVFHLSILYILRPLVEVTPYFVGDILFQKLFSR